MEMTFIFFKLALNASLTLIVYVILVSSTHGASVNYSVLELYYFL